MRLRSEVSFVKVVAGWRRRRLRAPPPRSTKTPVVATVPIGYADGVRRNLGLVGGEVLIGGRRRPVVGVVTMDQLMVVCDDTVHVGDEVVLIWRQGDERVTATEWADRLGTISYEIVCGIERVVSAKYPGKDQ